MGGFAKYVPLVDRLYIAILHNDILTKKRSLTDDTRSPPVLSVYYGMISTEIDITVEVKIDANVGH